MRLVPLTTCQNVLVAEVTFALCPLTSRDSSYQLGPAVKPKTASSLNDLILFNT